MNFSVYDPTPLRQAVREKRHKLGVSQEEFSDICGLDRTYIGGIERGERNVALVNISQCEVS